MCYRELLFLSVGCYYNPPAVIIYEVAFMTRTDSVYLFEKKKFLESEMLSSCAKSYLKHTNFIIPISAVVNGYRGGGGGYRALLSEHIFFRVADPFQPFNLFLFNFQVSDFVLRREIKKDIIKVEKK